MREEAVGSKDNLAVYRSMLISRLWAIIVPVGLYLLIATLLQSVGIYLPGFSETEFSINWGQQLFLAFILFVWLRNTPSAIRNAFRKEAVLMVEPDGISTPASGSLKWDEITKISNSFGWVKFYCEADPKDGFQVYSSYLHRSQWCEAKRIIKANLPANIEAKF